MNLCVVSALASLAVRGTGLPYDVIGYRVPSPNSSENIIAVWWKAGSMLEVLRAGLMVLGGLCVFACGFNVDTSHSIVREAALIDSDRNVAFGASVTIHEITNGAQKSFR